jgi:hypothetical protein
MHYRTGKLPWVAAAVVLLVSPGLGAQEEPAADSETGEAPTGEGETKSTKITDLEKRIEKLEAEIARLQEEAASDELEALQEAADAAAEEEEEKDETEAQVFKSGARALQAQNPEFSVTGDFLVRLWANDKFRKPYPPVLEIEEEGEHHHDASSELSGFQLRALELNIQANLDPYSFAKAVIAFHAGEVEAEEAYMTWVGVLPRLNLTIGRFRQQFGVVNRWHTHALDQIDLPLSLQMAFGHHGLAQTGLSLKVMIPRLWAHAAELTIEVTNAENGDLYAGEFWSVPSVLGHLKNYYDLTDTTYLELGLSGVWGFNNRRSFLFHDETTDDVTVENEPWRNTVVAGADLTISWVPLDKAKYRGVTWRTEALYMYKETPDGDIQTFGGYTYLDFRINQIVILGARLDAGQKPMMGDNREYVQASPYMTLWQSEWVYFRIQYNYLWQSGGYDPEHIVLLQADWSLGPHKHEKY